MHIACGLVSIAGGLHFTKAMIIIMYFCPQTAMSVVIVKTHTFCTMQVDKNRHNRTFYNSI